MIDQKVPGEGGQPRGKCPFFKVIAAHRPINPDKDLLRQVLGVVGRVGKAVAQVVNAPVMEPHDLLPCRGIPCQASANKCPCLLLFQAVSPSNDTYMTGLLFKIMVQDPDPRPGVQTRSKLRSRLWVRASGSKTLVQIRLVCK